VFLGSFAPILYLKRSSQGTHYGPGQPSIHSSSLHNVLPPTRKHGGGFLVSHSGSNPTFHDPLFASQRITDHLQRSSIPQNMWHTNPWSTDATPNLALLPGVELPDAEKSDTSHPDQWRNIRSQEALRPEPSTSQNEPDQIGDGTTVPRRKFSMLPEPRPPFTTAPQHQLQQHSDLPGSPEEADNVHQPYPEQWFG
jgi:hypothetical protein